MRHGCRRLIHRFPPSITVNLRRRSGEVSVGNMPLLIPGEVRRLGRGGGAGASDNPTAVAPVVLGSKIGNGKRTAVLFPCCSEQLVLSRNSLILLVSARSA